MNNVLRMFKDKEEKERNQVAKGVCTKRLRKTRIERVWPKKRSSLFQYVHCGCHISYSLMEVQTYAVVRKKNYFAKFLVAIRSIQELIQIIFYVQFRLLIYLF